MDTEYKSNEEYQGYVIARDPNFCHYVIKFDGKGSIGDSLDGYFQRKDLAKLAIDRYLDEKDKKPKSSLLEEIRAETPNYKKTVKA